METVTLAVRRGCRGELASRRASENNVALRPGVNGRAEAAAVAVRASRVTGDEGTAREVAIGLSDGCALMTSVGIGVTSVGQGNSAAGEWPIAVMPVTGNCAVDHPNSRADEFKFHENDDEF
jgi:hypothetical protein